LRRNTIDFCLIEVRATKLPFAHNSPPVQAVGKLAFRVTVSEGQATGGMKVVTQRYSSRGKGAIVSRHNRKKPKTLSATWLALFHASIQVVEKTGPEEKKSPRDRETEVSECIDAPFGPVIA